MSRGSSPEAALKTEEARRPYSSKAAAHAGIASYIHGFYNPTRLHSTLGYLSPNNYAKQLQGNMNIVPATTAA